MSGFRLRLLILRVESNLEHFIEDSKHVHLIKYPWTCGLDILPSLAKDCFPLRNSDASRVVVTGLLLGFYFPFVIGYDVVPRIGNVAPRRQIADVRSSTSQSGGIEICTMMDPKNILIRSLTSVLSACMPQLFSMNTGRVQAPGTCEGSCGESLQVHFLNSCLCSERQIVGMGCEWHGHNR